MESAEMDAEGPPGVPSRRLVVVREPGIVHPPLGPEVKSGQGRSSPSHSPIPHPHPPSRACLGGRGRSAEKGVACWAGRRARSLPGPSGALTP